MLSLVIGAALGGEGDFTYGGALSVGADATDTAFSFNPIEAEIDLEATSGIVYARADLDVHIDVTGDYRDTGEPGLASPLGPEWAMVQIGQKTQYVRLGITNPAVGYEDWDQWQNDLPTYSILFNAASPGRNLGVEAGMYLENGADVFLWGGYDLEWGYPMAGVGVAHDGDSFGTWSGIIAYPSATNENDGSKGTYATFDSLELYPADQLWIVLDGGGGLLTGKLFYGAQVFLIGFPEKKIGVTVRAEYARGEDDVFNQFGDQYPTMTAGAGVRLRPSDYFRADIEAKAQQVDGVFGPLIHAQLTVMGP